MRNLPICLCLAVPVVLLALASGASGAPLLSEDFNAAFPPAGWTVVNDIDLGVTWTLNTAVPETNLTGGTGTAAMADSLGFPFTGYDTSLISPSVVLPGVGPAELQFLSSLEIFWGDEVADVDVTTNGGTSWSNVWTSQTTGTGPEAVALNSILGETIQVRFRYSNLTLDPWDLYWQVDDVVVTPEPGSLVLIALGVVPLVLHRLRRRSKRNE